MNVPYSHHELCLGWDQDVGYRLALNKKTKRGTASLLVSPSESLPADSCWNIYYMYALVPGTSSRSMFVSVGYA